jgi:hypothetical protein
MRSPRKQPTGFTFHWDSKRQELVLVASGKPSVILAGLFASAGYVAVIIKLCM